MYDKTMRMLGRALDEMQYWTLALRVGKFAPEGRPFLAAHAHRAAAAVRAFYNDLSEAHGQKPYHSPYGESARSTGNETIDNPELVRLWVPDTVSTVRAMSTIELAARHWCQDLPRAALTPTQALALRCEVGRTVRALEAFAALVETCTTEAIIELP